MSLALSVALGVYGANLLSSLTAGLLDTVRSRRSVAKREAYIEKMQTILDQLEVSEKAASTLESLSDDG